MNRNQVILAFIGICLLAVISQAQVATSPASGQRGGARSGAPGNAMDLLAPLAVTQGRGAPAGNLQNAWWTDTALMARLGLTDLQKLKIENSFQAYRQPLTSSKETLEKEEAQLSRLLDVDSVDRSAVMLQVNKVIQARNEMERVNAVMSVEMREQLTRAQWAQLQTQPNGPRGGRGGGTTGVAPAPDSFAARFAADKPVTLDARVTDFKFQDPHVLIMFEAVDKDGKGGSWTGELGSATNLARQGWNSSTLKPGDRVVVEGSHSLDPTENLVNIRSIRRIP